jgi:uncharacterized protein (TIGR02001 family)
MRAVVERLWILLLAAGFASAGARAEVDARLTVASSYVHRGLEYDASAPSWQAGLEYRRGDAFAGVWAAQIDVDGYANHDQRGLELDYYLGFGRRLTSRLAIEATAIRYTYRGRSPVNDPWNELQLTAYLGERWTVTWGVAEGWARSDATSRFVEATLRHPLPARLVLDVTAGYQLARRAAGLDYGYAEAGVSIGFRDLVLRVGRTAVEADAREWFAPLADDRWVASLTWVP